MSTMVFPLGAGARRIRPTAQSQPPAPVGNAYPGEPADAVQRAVPGDDDLTMVTGPGGTPEPPDAATPSEDDGQRTQVILTPPPNPEGSSDEPTQVRREP
jgi:hypothetical protein